MSEVLLPAATSSSGSSYTAPTSQTTRLIDFPATASFHLWRKPPTGITPVDGGELHVSELIPGDGDFLLVCFASMATDEWETMKRELDLGERLGLCPLLVGSQDQTHIASALWGAGESCARHGLTQEPKRGTVFIPSLTLMRLLQVDRKERIRNALILIRGGHVVAKWISEGDGDRPHNWTNILSLVG